MSGGSGPVSARAFFFADGRDSDAEVVNRSLQQQGVLGSVGRGLELLDSSTRALLVHELSAVIARLLDLDLSDVLVAGWRTHRALRAAAQRSLVTAPDGEELVGLASHKVESVHTPHVDLLLNGQRITTIEVVNTIAMDVDALVAVVRAGALVGMQGGACLATLTVTVEGLPVVTRSRRFDAPLHISFGDGHDLIGR